MSAPPRYIEIARYLSEHPQMPIPASIDHTGGGIFCVRVDVDRISDVGPHEGPYLYITPREDFDGEPGYAVGLYPTWEHDGCWPNEAGEWIEFPNGGEMRYADSLEALHALVLEGAEILSKGGPATYAEGPDGEDFNDPYLAREPSDLDFAIDRLSMGFPPIGPLSREQAQEEARYEAYLEESLREAEAEGPGYSEAESPAGWRAPEMGR